MSFTTNQSSKSSLFHRGCERYPFRHASYVTTSTRRCLAAFKPTLASIDPYKILGLSSKSSEKEIKKAHRKLVLQNHPDLHSQGDPIARAQVEARFIAIQEAYEILIGKRRGKEIDESNSWSFHDWYWSFSMKRRRSTSSPPPQTMRQQWQTQLSGLKAKAAAKRYNQHSNDVSNTSSTSSSSSVWRSMTKNNKNTQKAAGAPSDSVDRAVPASATRSTDPSNVVPVPCTAAAAHMQPASGRENTASHTAADIHHTEHIIDSSTDGHQHTFNTSSASSPSRLRAMLHDAVHAVHAMQHRHHTAVHAHTRRMESHIASLGNQFSKHIRCTPGVFAATDRAALHVDGIASPSATAPATTGGNVSQVYDGEIPVNSNAVCPGYPYDTHERKFADKDHIRSRTSMQLAGLKRRAAMKEEVDIA